MLSWGFGMQHYGRSLMLGAAVLSVFLNCRLCAHGDLHEQIEKLTQAINGQPNDADLWLKRGELRRVHGDYRLALADYDEALRLNPKLKVANFCRGQALLAMAAAKEADTALSAFLQTNPSHEGALITRARARAMMKAYGDACDDFTKAIAINPKNLELYLEKASALQALNKNAEALAALDAGIAEIGQIVVLELRAIDLQVALQQYDGALARLEVLTAQSARKESWLERRGNILKQAGRMKEANAAYAEALAEISKLNEAQRRSAFVRDMETRLRAVSEARSGR